MNLRTIFLWAASAVCSSIILESCQETDYMIFDKNYSGIYFTEDSLHYSFSTLPIETRTYTQKIPVKIMGAPYNHDRLFTVEVLPAIVHVHPQAGIQYNLRTETLLIRADSITGYIPVELLRDGLAGDDETGYTRYELRLHLVANNNFTPTLGDADQHIVLTFDNAIEKPSWYNEGVWLNRCGEWHPLKLIKLMEFFHTTLKESVPLTYEKMVKDIGENWERTQYGWPTDYNYMIRKYILTPMYEYFESHPEHGITDFPNPNV